MTFGRVGWRANPTVSVVGGLFAELLLAAAWVSTVAILLPGCESEAARETPEGLRSELADKMPEGWKISFAREVTFPLQSMEKPGDLIVWKTQKVNVQSRPAATQPVVNPTTLYYSLSFRDYVPTEKYNELWNKQEELRKDHARVLHKVEMVRRDEKGNLWPRGTVEQLEVAAFRAAYAKLPPYDPDLLPTHHFGSVAVRIRDWRGNLFPEDREFQTEQNKVYAAMLSILKSYRKQ